jgi:guanylate kinase
VQNELKVAHRDYVAKHPELKTILNDFTTAVLTEKPEDVVEFAKSYFMMYAPSA